MVGGAIPDWRSRVLEEKQAEQASTQHPTVPASHQRLRPGSCLREFLRWPPSAERASRYVSAINPFLPKLLSVMASHIAIVTLRHHLSCPEYNR